jgi:hypothetical protein
MRNRLVHNYFEVDLSLLWTTVVDDLPELIGPSPPPWDCRPARCLPKARIAAS